MLSGAQTHANDICLPARQSRMRTPSRNKASYTGDPPDLRKFIHNVLGDTFSVLLTSGRVRQDDLVDNLAHRPLEALVAVVVIWTGEARREPGRLRVWY